MLHINGANFFSAESPSPTWGFNQVEDLQEKDRPYLSRFFVVMLVGMSVHEGIRNVACLVIKPPVDSFAFTVGQIPLVKERVWTQLEDLHLVEETALKTFMVLAFHVYKTVMFLIFSPLCCICIGFISPSLNKKIHEWLKLIDAEKVDDGDQEELEELVDTLDLEDPAQPAAVPPTPPPRTFLSSAVVTDQNIPAPPPPPQSRAKKEERIMNQQEPPEVPPRSPRKSVRVVSPQSTISGSAEAAVRNAPPPPPPSRGMPPPPPPPSKAVAKAEATSGDLASQLRRKLQERQQAGGQPAVIPAEAAAESGPPLRRKSSGGLHPTNPALQKFINVGKEEKRRSGDFNRASAEWRDDNRSELQRRLAGMKKAEEAGSSVGGNPVVTGEATKQASAPAQEPAKASPAQPKGAVRKLPPLPTNAKSADGSQTPLSAIPGRMKEHGAKASPGVKFVESGEVINSSLPSAEESNGTPQGKSILKRRTTLPTEMTASSEAPQESSAVVKEPAGPAQEDENLDRQEATILLQIKMLERSKSTQGTMSAGQLMKMATRLQELDNKLEEIKTKKAARNGSVSSSEVAPADSASSAPTEEGGVAVEIDSN